MLREGVRRGAARARLALIVDLEAVLLPGPIEQREQPMIEDVKKVTQPEILVPLALEDQHGVMARHRAGGAGQRHKSLSHPGG